MAQSEEGVEEISLDEVLNQYADEINENTSKLEQLEVKNYATTTSPLNSGATGSPGVADAVSRGDHTHTLPAYPTLASLGAANSSLSNVANADFVAKASAAGVGGGDVSEQIGTMLAQKFKIKNSEFTTSDLPNGAWGGVYE